MLVIDVRALHVLEELGGGRRGVVRRVAVPDPAAPVVAYREYRPDLLADVRWPVLEALIDLPGEVDGATRAWFAEHTAWPSRLVTRDGQPIGFLMPLVPPTRLVDLA